MADCSSSEGDDEGEPSTNEPDTSQDQSPTDNDSASLKCDQDNMKKSVSWAEEEQLVEVREIEGNPMWRPGPYGRMLTRCCCCCRKKRKRQNY